MTEDELDQIEFWVAKPPAHIMIDDRAMRFEGVWGEPAWDIEDLKSFKPWNYRERH